MSNNKTERLPAIFITHGGGPCFFMEWDPPDAWKNMADSLKNLGNTFNRKPKALLVFSGHWEEKEFTIHTGAKPSLLYDYYGFPEHTYDLTYEAPGAPELAEQVKKLLADDGIPFREEEARGWDHGVFIPLKLIYPDADIPVLQISLKRNLSPAEHIKIGRALLPLREQGVLIIGSGSSYHNLRAFGPNGGPASKQFDNWLTDVVSIEDRIERENQLSQWSQAPSGRMAHPREEHLIPLMVVAGSADSDENGRKVFSDNIMGLTLSFFQFG